MLPSPAMTRWSSRTGLIGPRFFDERGVKKRRRSAPDRSARGQARAPAARGRMKIERAQRTRILEHDARAVGEVDRRARERGSSSSARSSASRRSSENAHGATRPSSSMKQLMLPAALDVADARAAQRTQRAAGDSSA